MPFSECEVIVKQCRAITIKGATQNRSLVVPIVMSRLLSLRLAVYAPYNAVDLVEASTHRLEIRDAERIGTLTTQILATVVELTLRVILPLQEL